MVLNARQIVKSATLCFVKNKVHVWLFLVILNTLVGFIITLLIFMVKSCLPNVAK